MKDLKFYIFIITALLVIYLVAEYNRPKPINWTETLSANDKIPFGTYVLYHQLNDIFPKADIEKVKEPVYNVINDHNVEHGTYLIICNEIDLNEYDYDKLTGFIKKGNDVFIAASSFGTYFDKKLHVETQPEFVLRHTPGDIKYVNKNLDTTQLYSVDKNMADAYFVNIDTTKAAIISENTEHHINYIKYKMGKGILYLNTNPLMFTNYSLMKESGAEYSATALSYLKNDKKLIWDEYYIAGREDDQSLMRVFLRSNSLRSAYYIALFSLLIFVIYEVKRRQRIIPVIEPLANTTLDFVNVVGQVYYEQRNNSNIAQKKAAYFLEYIRAKYHLKTSLLNYEFKDALANKSGVERNLIDELIHQIILVRGGMHVNDNDLIEINKNIEQFYLQSR